MLNALDVGELAVPKVDRGDEVAGGAVALDSGLGGPDHRRESSKVSNGRLGGLNDCL